MQMQLAIFNPVTDVLIADWSNRVTSCSMRSGTHGYESCEAAINVPFFEAFLYYQQLGPLKLRVSWGSYRVWEGRLEDPTQFTGTSSGLKVTAFGAWVAFNDVPYTALWSDTKFDGWREYLSTDDVGFNESLYEFDTNSRISIVARKNEIFGSTGVLKEGGQVYDRLDQSSRQITGISFDFQLSAPTNWVGRLISYTINPYTFVAVPWTLNGNGGIQGGAVNITLTACDRLVFGLRYNAADAAYVGETGNTYLRITNLRIVTSTANRVNTTLTANRAAGSNVTATVGTTARMFVGGKLQINQSAAPSETVTVLSIGGATTFNATFIGSYVSGNAVQGHIIYPDEIIKNCVSTVNALNPTQLSSDVTLIQSQSVDIDQSIYEDVYPTEIINQLLTKSDNAALPRQWVALVYDNQRLIVRPRGSGAVWFADISSLDVVRTLTNLYNSLYAVYSDSSNKRNLRTAVSTDAASVTKFQITRRKAVTIDTTDSPNAIRSRDAVLALQTDPIPRAQITLDRIFDASGTANPLFMVHSDDTLTLRNLPPILGGIYDKIRTLVITRTDYNITTNALTLELEIPIPNIDVQLAQALKGSM